MLISHLIMLRYSIIMYNAIEQEEHISHEPWLSYHEFFQEMHNINKIIKKSIHSYNLKNTKTLEEIFFFNVE